MLRSISSTTLQTWKAFEELEPFPDERLDLNSAHIVQYLWALAGDPQKRYPNGRKLGEFKLSYDSAPEVAPNPTQTLAFQEMIIDGWCRVNNMLLQKKASDGN